MEVIKFNLDDLKNNLDGFSCYILGRSYDLEENGVTADYKNAKTGITFSYGKENNQAH